MGTTLRDLLHPQLLITPFFPCLSLLSSVLFFPFHVYPLYCPASVFSVLPSLHCPVCLPCLALSLPSLNISYPCLFLPSLPLLALPCLSFSLTHTLSLSASKSPLSFHYYLPHQQAANLRHHHHHHHHITSHPLPHLTASSLYLKFYLFTGFHHVPLFLVHALHLLLPPTNFTPSTLPPPTPHYAYPLPTIFTPSPLPPLPLIYLHSLSSTSTPLNLPPPTPHYLHPLPTTSTYSPLPPPTPHYLHPLPTTSTTSLLPLSHPPVNVYAPNVFNTKNEIPTCHLKPNTAPSKAHIIL
ncbi:hypothetical protein Pmani_039853 [Petrolisthes manimaculis]|uniref:Uncharacterized protein n=1 Tax=Petrolisthes manimaculis TaxID=1843537 RepID=A0AAE1NBQ2_9EUCA|nr:hypothetical protein Pmani_039853 [Petrolisthes manimaculis]